MSIVKECMVVNLQIGMWNGYKLDKESSKRVTEQASADADSARVNKHLVPKEALKNIVSAAGLLRMHFYNNTLPWKDNGDRLLTRKLYMQFVQDHSQHVKTFNEAVEQFLTVDYPKVVDQAAFRMGELFKAEDYPAVSDLRRKFYVRMDIDAVTEAADFRVAMDTAVVDEIKMDIYEALQGRLSRAMGDVWSRLADTLGHFAAKMSEDAIFRDSTVTNLEEIVELLPSLNFMDDPDLDAIRQDIKQSIVGYSPKELRKDAAAKTQAALDAKRIMDNMAGFMKAFGEQT